MKSFKSGQASTGFVRKLCIAFSWKAMRLISWRGIRSVGILKLLRPVRASDAGITSTVHFFPGSKEVRMGNLPARSTDETQNYPPLGFRKITNGSVTANRRLSAVVWENFLLLPAGADAGPWRLGVGEPPVAGFLRQSDDDLLVLHKSSGQHLASGVFVGTWSSHNWFHWLIDTLPSVLLANSLPDQFDSYPVLLDEEALKRPEWLEPLKLVIGKRDLVSLQRSRYTTVENLLWIDSPTSPGPLPSRPSGRPSFRMHREGMRHYRDYMVRELKLESAVPLRGRRVYLGRKTTPNRPYNQDELIAESKRFGYEPVFLEDLSFRDSVKVMMEAESVIGPHGAGWANALFCHPGTSGVMWTWRDSMRDNWFANVASIAGMNFQCLFTEESDSQKYNLSPHLLRLTLEQVRTHPFGEGLGKSREIANC